MNLEFEKRAIQAILTAQLNVSQHDTMKILFNLHFRMENGKTSRSDCSMQVLNAYDYFCEYIDFFIHDYTDWYNLQMLHIHERSKEIYDITYTSHTPLPVWND